MKTLALALLLAFTATGCGQDDGTAPTAPGRVTEPTPAPDAGQAAAAAVVPPAADAGTPEAAPAAPEAAPPTDTGDGTVYRTCAGANPVTTTVTNCDVMASQTLGAPASCVAVDGAHLYGCELSNPSGVAASCVKTCP